MKIVKFLYTPLKKLSQPAPFYADHVFRSVALHLCHSWRQGFCTFLAACFAMSLSTLAIGEEHQVVSSETAILNINTADAEAIATQLSGIGAVRAQAIVDYRLKYGDFLHIDELQDVPGIGEVTFERIKSQLSVTSGAESNRQHDAETAQLSTSDN